MPTILLHGGAGSWISVSSWDNVLAAILECTKRGYARLAGGSPLDSVEEAVACMEESGVFNAGLGAYPNAEGRIELDAGIMDGSSLHAGAVVCVRNVPTPIRLARVVMEETPHVIIACEQAEKLAKTKGLWKQIKTPRDRLALLAKRLAATAGSTVGAVAVKQGSFAAATSTGGLIGKLPCRVGDSPIPGAGYYADTRGAASATGIGEKILARPASFAAVSLLDRLDAVAAAFKTVKEISTMLGEDSVGIIVVGKRSAGVALNTRAMPIAIASDKGYRALIATRDEIDHVNAIVSTLFSS